MTKIDPVMELAKRKKGEVRHTKETQIKETLPQAAKQIIAELAQRVEDLEKRLQRNQHAVNIIIEAAREYEATQKSDS
jgi:uncharacterized alpha-E superfamily protein